MATVNTILYQPVELKCWQRLVAASLTSINWLSADDTYRVYDKPHRKFSKDLIAAVEQEMSDLCETKVSVVESLIFRSRPDENPPIHVDGKDINRTAPSQVALNVPILNCNDSQMIWYGGEYDLSVYTTESNPNVYSLGIEWFRGPNEIFCQEIATPALVRVDVPHRVVNQQSKPRVMLSMRFSPMLTFSPLHPCYGSTH